MNETDRPTVEPVNLQHVQHFRRYLTIPLFPTYKQTTAHKSPEFEHIVSAIAELDFDSHCLRSFHDEHVFRVLPEIHILAFKNCRSTCAVGCTGFQPETGNSLEVCHPTTVFVEVVIRSE